MKTRNIISASILVVILLLTAQFASATNYYMCSGSTLSLSAPTDATVTYSWDLKEVNGTTSVLGFPRATPPTTEVPTATGTYKLLLITTPTDPTKCAPDVVEHNIVVVPALSITLGNPSVAAYCNTSTTTNTSTLTPTALETIAAGLATDLELEYSYIVLRGATPVASSTVGSMDPTTKVYTLNTTTAGVYTITGQVKYKQKVANPVVLLNSSGCAAGSTKTVTVNDKPTAPIISIAAN